MTHLNMRELGNLEPVSAVARAAVSSLIAQDHLDGYFYDSVRTPMYIGISIGVLAFIFVLTATALARHLRKSQDRAASDRFKATPRALVLPTLERTGSNDSVPLYTAAAGQTETVLEQTVKLPVYPDPALSPNSNLRKPAQKWEEDEKEEQPKEVPTNIV